MKINRILWGDLPDNLFIYLFRLTVDVNHRKGDLDYNTRINDKKKTRLSKTFILFNIIIT